MRDFRVLSPPSVLITRVAWETVCKLPAKFSNEATGHHTKDNPFPASLNSGAEHGTSRMILNPPGGGKMSSGMIR